MIEAVNLDLVANGRSYCAARKCRRKHFQRYLGPVRTKQRRRVKLGSAIVVASRSGLGSHMLSDFISSQHSPCRVRICSIRLLWISHRGHGSRVAVTGSSPRGAGIGSGSPRRTYLPLAATAAVATLWPAICSDGGASGWASVTVAIDDGGARPPLSYCRTVTTVMIVQARPGAPGRKRSRSICSGSTVTGH